MLNLFTVDLEDWYCSRALEGVIPRSGWSACESRVGVGTELLLALLRRHEVHATFFVLGYVAGREPDLVRRIAGEGHEIATHGYFHHHLAEQTPEEFREDLERAIAVTQPLSGSSILGYRAPIFSFIDSTIGWGSEIVKGAGIRYSSSVFPMRGHREYGLASAPLDLFHHANGLAEVPMSCVEVGGRRVPATGGGWMRHFPLKLTRSLIRRCNDEGRPAVIYIHPWEVDRWQPKVKLPAMRHLRHYHGIGGMLAKVDRLLEEFPFTTMRSMLETRGVFDDAEPD
jgi:polysaccharide deacetylase family protein (PEP-CTERM system associated)